MKYLITFLIILCFIGPVASKDKSLSTVLKDGFYNYLSSFDNTYNYLITNVDFFKNLHDLPYDKAYDKVMKNRTFQKHLVSPGENLYSIIKSYNSDVKDIESFRKVVYKENPNKVTSDYNLKSGEYIIVPSE